MVMEQDVAKVILLLILSFWLLALSKQLWFYYKIKSRQVLIILLKDQEEIVEGIIYCLKKYQAKIDADKWEIFLVDIGSQDKTEKILKCLTSKFKVNIAVFSIPEADKQDFFKKVLEQQVNKRVLVLSLTGKINGREVEANLGGIFKRKQQCEVGQIQILEEINKGEG